MYLQELTNGTAREKDIRDLLEIQYGNMGDEMPDTQPPPNTNTNPISSDITDSSFIRSCDLGLDTLTIQASTSTPSPSASSLGTTFDDCGLGILPVGEGAPGSRRRTPPTAAPTTTAGHGTTTTVLESVVAHSEGAGCDSCRPRRPSACTLLELDSSFTSDSTSCVLFTDEPIIGSVDASHASTPSSSTSSSSSITPVPSPQARSPFPPSPVQARPAPAPDTAALQVGQLFSRYYPNTTPPPETVSYFVGRVRAGTMTLAQVEAEIRAAIQHYLEQQPAAPTTAVTAQGRRPREGTTQVDQRRTKIAAYLREAASILCPAHPLSAAEVASTTELIVNGSKTLDEVEDELKRRK